LRNWVQNGEPPTPATVFHGSPGFGARRFKRIVQTSTIEENYMSIWTILFVVLLVAWISGFTVFHVAGGLIHLLLVLAVISLILHFVMGRRTA
jgi:uncharacterized protein DUF5670